MPAQLRGARFAFLSLQLKVPERCEQLQCYKCDYGVVKAVEVWQKVRHSSSAALLGLAPDSD